MNDLCVIAPPQPLNAAAPYRLAGHTHRHILHAWLSAAGLVALCSAVIFGVSALVVIGAAVASAIATDALMALLARDRLSSRWQRAALTGLLLSLTLPATTPWSVALFGSVIAVVIGQGVFQGVLHPALVGRVVTQFVFSGYLSLSGNLLYSPVLTPGRVLVGDLNDAERVADYHGWLESQEATTHDAYEIHRPVQLLRQFAQSRIAPDGDLLFTPLIRDHLPPWRDTVFGVVPGGNGETCTIALVVVGLLLIHRGFLRWQLPLTILAAA
ncbi:MAG TPA: RnfABCDGE type electron transport complex subunit D, partial [Phycisphaerae bacterium]|nr:RnfABCDGE type electron transport complex subunit D [Phycisphaerae bacterium]